MSKERELFEFLKEFAVRAGKISIPYYGKIERHTKPITVGGKIVESSVTAIDFAIQELLLAELFRRGFTEFALNAEEETPLKFFFNNNFSSGITLHVDPIDGTKSFQSGNNRYAIGMGLSRVREGNHEFFASVVYSPIENELYWAFEDEKSPQKKLHPPAKKFQSHRALNDQGKHHMDKAGLTSYYPGGAHLGIVDMALGKLSVYALWRIEVHDAFIPYAFAQQHGVFLVDGNGNELHNPFELEIQHGKFTPLSKLTYFTSKKAFEEFWPVFENPKNLHNP